jgi:hypothetical protein
VAPVGRISLQQSSRGIPHFVDKRQKKCYWTPKNTKKDTAAEVDVKLAVFILLGGLILTPGIGIAQDVETSMPAGEEQVASELTTLTHEERVWLKRFQDGYLMVDGWKEISDAILSQTPSELREEQKERLDSLGWKIGLEWCRDNSIRKVDTDMLKEWGALLKNTAKKDPHKIGDVLASIDQEVDAILE